MKETTISMNSKGSETMEEIEKRVDKGQQPVLKILRELRVEESATFPATRTAYIKTACTNFGFQWGKKFKTSINREMRTITVVRTE